ncbi:MAG: energy transducer TonB, partial [Brevundimonas sp.]|nr:energy transducer TonB [Brevundimonas sp.]
RFGAQVGRCWRYMPADQIAAFEAGASPASPADPPGGQAVLDQVFYISYQQGRQSAGATAPRRDRCEAMVEDAAAILVDAEPLISAIEAEMPPVSTRPWAAFVPASARAPERAPRVLEPLREPAAPDRAMRPNAVSRPPTWAQTPRLAMPSAARHLNEGSAHIECIVTIEGRARACRLLRESVEGLGLGAAALGAEHSYRFHPRTIDGQPVEARAAFAVRFRNQDRTIEIR